MNTYGKCIKENFNIINEENNASQFNCAIKLIINLSEIFSTNL